MSDFVRLEDHEGGVHHFKRADVVRIGPAMSQWSIAKDMSCVFISSAPDPIILAVSPDKAAELVGIPLQTTTVRNDT